MLAAIWSQVDTLLPKQIEEKPVNINFCRECSGVKVISPEGLPTCSDCGLVDSYFVDDTAEWTSCVTDDGKVNDPSRCGTQMQTQSCFHNIGARGPSSLHNMVRHMKIANGED